MFFYLIKLERNKYYILFSPKKDFSIKDLMTFEAVDWVLINKPISIVKKILYTGEYTVNDYVLEYMNIYGKDYVRGGDYSEVVLTSSQNNLLSSLLNKMNPVSEDEHLMTQPKRSISCIQWLRNCINKKDGTLDSLL